MKSPPAAGEMATRSDCSSVERLGGKRIFPIPLSLISYLSVYNPLQLSASVSSCISPSGAIAPMDRFVCVSFLIAGVGFALSLGAFCLFWSDPLTESLATSAAAVALLGFFLVFDLAFDLILESPFFLNPTTLP